MSIAKSICSIIHLLTGEMICMCSNFHGRIWIMNRFTWLSTSEGLHLKRTFPTHKCRAFQYNWACHAPASNASIHVFSVNEYLHFKNRREMIVAFVFRRTSSNVHHFTSPFSNVAYSLFRFYRNNVIHTLWNLTVRYVVDTSTALSIDCKRTIAFILFCILSSSPKVATTKSKRNTQKANETDTKT